MGFSGRVQKLRSLVKERSLDAVLLTDPKDVFYYSGLYSEDQAFLIIRSDSSRPLLLVSRLNNEAVKTAKARVVFFDWIKDITKELSGDVGFDENQLTVRVFSSLKHRGVKFKKAASLIKEPRIVKDKDEIASIKQAIKATKAVISALNIYGETEKGVAKAIEKEFLDLGMSNAFSPIVASGKNTNFIHYTPGKRKIMAKDFVIVDLGCKFNHYCSDITRTFHPKGNVSKGIVDGIANIQQEIADFITPGIEFSDVQKFYENKMNKKKYKIMHSFGHGIGLDVHERPHTKDRIMENTVLTIEPGVYTKGKGCRVEDMFLVRNRPKKLS